MLRRRLQQLSSVVNLVTFTLILSLLLAHIILRRYLPNVAHGKENFDFFFEGDQEGDDQHHPPFVINWRVVLGTFLAFLVSCAVDVGGLAGGGLLVPVFWQVVCFGLKASTGLSQAAIAGASAAALAANIFRAQVSPPDHQHGSSGTTGSSAAQHAPHASTGAEQQHLQDSARLQPGHALLAGQQQQQHLQQQQQPLVDLDLVLLLTPGVLLGVAVGALMNDLLPDWFITAALVGVLWLSCHKTAVRGLLMWHAEAQAEASLAAAAAIQGGPQPRLRPIQIGPVSARGADSPRSCRSGRSNSNSSTPGRKAQGMGMFGRNSSSCPALHTVSPVAGGAAAAIAAAVDSGGLPAASEAQQGQSGGQHNLDSSSGPPGSKQAPHSESSTPQPSTPQPSSGSNITSDCPINTSFHPADGAAAAAAKTAWPEGSNGSELIKAATAAAASAAAVAQRPPSRLLPSAASDSDSSGSPRSVGLRHQRSLPVYECETTPLPPSGHYSTAGVPLLRPGLVRKGLFPGWFSPPTDEDDTADAAAGGGGPTAAWRPYSRSSSSCTNVGYIMYNHLPAWQQQQQHLGASRAAAAAAVQLQQLWLWLPHVHLQQMPWMKLVSLWALWLGFMGLAALSGLLPVCSWPYVTYLLLFMGITGCVTATLIRVLLVQPLLGAQQVSRLSHKLQQFVHKHSRHQHSGAPDLEAAVQQQQQYPELQQPLLLQDDLAEQQQQLLQLQQQHGDAGHQPQQWQQGVTSQPSSAPAAGAAAAGRMGAVRKAAARARLWLHVLTGFGRQPAATEDQQQQEGVAHTTGAAMDHQQQGLQQPGGDGQQQQQEPLSLFTQMRLQQLQQQGPWGPVQPPPALLPPMGPVAAATDSYFFPGCCDATGAAAAAAGADAAAAGGVGQLARAPPKRVLAPVAPAAAAGNGSSGGNQQQRRGVAAAWAGLRRLFQGSGAAAAQEGSGAALDPFDGNEQPWRYEEPFPVAAASPGPVPSLAAAAAAAATNSASSSALVTIAAAAAVVSVAAGVVTAVTGVASSALFMPILLDFRVHTQVAMASTVVLVFLSSSAATMSFILQGRLIGTYALLFSLVGLCGGCVGVSVVGALLRLARRPSLVVLLLAAALALAGLSCSVTGVQGLVEALERGERLGFRSVCSA